MNLISIDSYNYHDAKVFIGSESNFRIRIHLCTKDNHHLYGYRLFAIDRDGYLGDPSIGGCWEIDQLMDLAPGGKLLIAGFDNI